MHSPVPGPDLTDTGESTWVGNPPSLLLGSPPGQHCADPGVAIKALFPFTEFVFLPWSRGPRRRISHQIQTPC